MPGVMVTSVPWRPGPDPRRRRDARVRDRSPRTVRPAGRPADGRPIVASRAPAARATLSHVTSPPAVIVGGAARVAPHPAVRRQARRRGRRARSSLPVLTLVLVDVGERARAGQRPPALPARGRRRRRPSVGWGRGCWQPSHRVFAANWFLIPPYHTLAIESRDSVVELVVFVVVAVVVSLTVELAARERARAGPRASTRRACCPGSRREPRRPSSASRRSSSRCGPPSG